MKLYVFGLCAGLALASPFALAADAGKSAKGEAKPAKSAPAKPAPAKAEEKSAPAKAEEPKLVPPEVVKQMGELVRQGAQRASAELQVGDEFQPYGVVQHKDGNIYPVRFQKSEDPNARMPPAVEIFRQINLTILDTTRKNPDIVAAATFAPTAETTSDGKTRVPMIRAEVDHRDGTPLIVLLPFQRVDGKLQFGSTPSLPGTNILFFREQPAADAAAPAAAAPAKAP